MFTKGSRNQYLTRRYLWLWVALAFQAGAANAGGFLACARFVSHMTGIGSQIGLSIAELEYAVAFEMLTAPLSFVLGAMVSALLVDRRMLRDEPPLYLWVLAALVTIFAVASAGGNAGLFGAFGEPLRYQRDFALMCLLCFACGLQNACFGSLTRGQIRTTHLTGILTDFGVTMVRLRYLSRQNRETRRLRRLNLIRLLTFVSFTTGSAIFAVLFAWLGFTGFGLLTVFSSLLLSILAYRQEILDGRRHVSDETEAETETAGSNLDQLPTPATENLRGNEREQSV